MSWIILPKPGSQYGPCVEQCSHIDCDKTRQMSQAICPLCGKPCGYEKQLTEIGGKLAHNACVTKRAQADQLSEVAEKVSAAANRWLAHPAEAHQAHERAASAWENVGHKNKAAEHRKAAGYWAKKELEWNSEKYALGKLRN